MRFQAYLKEDYDTARTTEIAVDKFKELIQGDYSKAYNMVLDEGFTIYRGTYGNGTPFMYGDPSKSTPRHSANTLNYYTLWMDNSKQWSKFPKRSKSYICSTSLSDAAGFGNYVYLVLPKNGAKIGMCPGPDLWVSFTNLKKMNNMAAIDIVEVIQHIFTNKDLDADDGNWNTFRNNLVYLDQQIKQGFTTAHDLFMDAYHGAFATRFQHMKNANPQSFTEAVEWLFDPTGFKVGTVQGLPKQREDRECWTEGPCLFFRLYNYDERDVGRALIDALNPEPVEDDT